MHAGQDGQVDNGSFERTGTGGLPERWPAAGDKAVVQELTVEKDPTRGHVASLRFASWNVPRQQRRAGSICPDGGIVARDIDVGVY